MSPNSTKNLLRKLLLKDAEDKLHLDDLTSRQRLNLFRTFSIAAFLVTLTITYQIISFFNSVDFVGVVLLGLLLIILTNYFLLNKHKNFKFSYWVIIFSSLLVVHFVTYYTGGIRNSGMMYMGGLILASFMLLGNKEGKIVSAISIVNLIFFYFYSTEFGRDNPNIIDTDKEGFMLDLDYLITYCTATVLIYSLSNNLESSKNIVIAKVTESKEALEIKNEELKKLSLVASKTENSVVITDKENRIEWVNDGFTRLTGYTLFEVQGKRMVDFLTAADSDSENAEKIKSHIQNKQSFSGEVLKIHKDGRPVWLQETITPISDESGEISQFIHVESDITERKEAEEKMAEYYRYLEKANKELDKFAYVVSHDLKAPLRAISNLSTWIEEDMGPLFNEESRNNFNMIKGRVVRMESLIQGILDYSRADRVKAPVTKVDIGELINEIVDMVIQDENIEIVCSSKLPTLTAEKMKLQQVFSNIISNSIKHNDKEVTRIEISAFEGTNDIEFSIEDNGPGIDEQFHDKIFVIFQTLQARDTFESTGVGLAIVKKIIDEVGGKIWIESEIGKYTKFKFKWPKHSGNEFKPFQFSLEQNSPNAVNTSTSKLQNA